MKKLSLGSFALTRGEVLSRSQLKKVLGGDGSGVVAECKCTNGTKCPAGTTSCSTTKINGVEHISCGSASYTKC